MANEIELPRDAAFIINKLKEDVYEAYDTVSIKCYGHKVFDERLIWKEGKYKKWF